MDGCFSPLISAVSLEVFSGGLELILGWSHGVWMMNDVRTKQRPGFITFFADSARKACPSLVETVGPMRDELELTRVPPMLGKILLLLQPLRRTHLLHYAQEANPPQDGYDASSGPITSAAIQLPQTQAAVNPSAISPTLWRCSEASALRYRAADPSAAKEPNYGDYRCVA